MSFSLAGRANFSKTLGVFERPLRGGRMKWRKKGREGKERKGRDGRETPPKENY